MRASALSAFAVALALSGCDTLFPEFSGKPPPDLATDPDAGADGGTTTPHLAGVVCVLGDLRDYRSCANGVPGMFRISVEETRDVGMTDASGHFTLALSRKLDAATVAAVDPLNRYAPSIIPLALTNGALDAVALPVVDQNIVANAAVQNGATLDPQRGTVIAWAVDPNGTPVSNVVCNPTVYTDGSATNQIFANGATGPHGTLGLFNAMPQAVLLALTPPASSLLKADQFSLPVRPSAVTLSRVVLLPR
jgi:hypothetical protein